MDTPNYSIIKMGQNTAKSPGDLNRLGFTQTLMWKTLKEWNNSYYNPSQKRRLIIFFSLGEATTLGEGILWILTCLTPLKNVPCIISCPSGGVGKYDNILNRFEIQMDHPLLAWWPELLKMNKKKEYIPPFSRLCRPSEQQS